MTDESLQKEVHKRFTLNWLIQGAAQHASMTFHHLVRDEMNAIEPRLLRLNDQFALVMLLQYWRGLAVIAHGRPRRFWKQAASKRSHPFFGHALFSRYGGMLAEAGRIRALERCKEKGVVGWPVVFSFQAIVAFHRLRRLESSHRLGLVQLARKCASSVWGIPVERMGGELVDRINPGEIFPTRNFQDAVMKDGMIGHGGVVWRGDQLTVVAHALVWQVLTHELVKGTAELVCLHGLNQLSDDTYRRVLKATDRLDLEPWMLQSGGELWRRLLEAIPGETTVARVLMHLASLPAGDLEDVMAGVIEGKEGALGRLAVGCGN